MERYYFTAFAKNSSRIGRIQGETPWARTGSGSTWTWGAPRSITLCTRRAAQYTAAVRASVHAFYRAIQLCSVWRALRLGALARRLHAPCDLLDVTQRGSLAALGACVVTLGTSRVRVPVTGGASVTWRG